MATKKKAADKTAPSTAIIPAQTRQLTTWRDRAKQSIDAAKQQLAKLPQPGGNFLSFRGGEITYGGQTLSSPLPVVLMAYGYERTYYPNKYTPGEAATPVCYSFDGEVPHEDSATPQSETCARCRMSQFGSDPQGDGPACKKASRIVLLHKDALKSPEAIAAAPLMEARLSFLNSKKLRVYVENLFGDRPSWSALSELTVVPDKKSMYAATFAPLADLSGNDEVMSALAARVDEAEKLLVKPYVQIEAREKQAPATARKRKF